MEFTSLEDKGIAFGTAERFRADENAFAAGGRNRADMGSLRSRGEAKEKFSGQFGLRGEISCHENEDDLRRDRPGARTPTWETGGGNRSGRQPRAALDASFSARNTLHGAIATMPHALGSRALGAYASAEDGTYDDGGRKAVGTGLRGGRIGRKVGRLRRLRFARTREDGAEGSQAIRMQRRSRSIRAAAQERGMASATGAATRMHGASATGTAIRVHAASAGVGGAPSAVGVGVGSSASAAASPIAIIVIIVALIAALIGGAQGDDSTQMGETERAVAAFFLAKGLDELHTAAIMGNMFAESGMRPSASEVGGTGIGIAQWSFGRADALKAYAEGLGKPWTDLQVQLDFFWDHDTWRSNWRGSYRTSGQREGDPATGTRVSGSKSGFLGTDNLDRAVEEFCYGWERPGIPRMAIRKEAAQRYYAQLTASSGHGEDYAAASAAQRALVNAANATPFQGSGWCAMWVSQVFSRAGYGRVTGHARDMFINWCHSSSRSELQVGMIVAVRSSSSGTQAGLTYGHVGIYIGDGMVMHNAASSVQVTPLDEWIAIYCKHSPARWGWANGIDLSAGR